MKRVLSEWLLLGRDRTAWLGYALFFVVCLVAVAVSVSTYRREARFQRALVEEEAQRVGALRQALTIPVNAPVPPWNDPGNPGAVGRGKAASYAVLPLGGLDVVRSRPVNVTAVAVSSEGGALDRGLSDLRQAHSESLGRFDLGFLILVVFPLAVLLFTFDIVARDHESGTARLLLASEPNPRLRYFTRAALRALPLVVMGFASVLLAAALTGGLSAAPLAELGAILLILLIGAVFWLSVSFWLAASFRTVTASGIAGLSAWAVFVILVPSVLSAFAEAKAPIPSRIERTIASREAARQATLEIERTLSRYLGDHPELAGTRANPKDYYVRRVALDDAVSAARLPVETQFFDAVEQRRVLTERLAIASPVSLAARGLDEIARAGEARVDRFRRQVNAFQRRFAAFFNEKVLRGERLSPSSLDRRPVFHFEEQPVSMWPLGALSLWTLLVFALAVWRLPSALELTEGRARASRAGARLFGTRAERAARRHPGSA